MNKLFFHFTVPLKRVFFSFMTFCIPYVLCGQKITVSLGFDMRSFTTENTDGFDIININNVDNSNVKYLMPTGYPRLPYMPFYVLLPHNAKIEQILITGYAIEPIEGEYNIIPTTFETDDLFSAYSADNLMHGTDSLDTSGVIHPGNTQVIYYSPSELYAGFLLNKIFACPFKYFPDKQQLFYYTRLTIDIYFFIEEKPLVYELLPDRIRASREFIRNMVVNTEEIDKTLPLKEKIDYSKIQIFTDSEKDSVKTKLSIFPVTKKVENPEPFYIKKLITK